MARTWRHCTKTLALSGACVVVTLTSLLFAWYTYPAYPMLERLPQDSAATPAPELHHRLLRGGFGTDPDDVSLADLAESVLDEAWHAVWPTRRCGNPAATCVVAAELAGLDRAVPIPACLVVLRSLDEEARRELREAYARKVWGGVERGAACDAVRLARYRWPAFTRARVVSAAGLILRRAGMDLNEADLDACEGF